ncbi:hypothetical protein [Tropicimonas sediminicola]|uniref:Uncharacterized protein n=1 Tax=Tropicimonas sediminicola TaxID=1031541 RepID=A0A239FBQ8_9RHOB|nr:hypothetical protein [Tropicimonas sediminicola]SNS53524.1 hypothetical protein SAMN05421757_102565 [Tropicimonas sediminicola]
MQLNSDFGLRAETGVRAPSAAPKVIHVYSDSRAVVDFEPAQEREGRRQRGRIRLPLDAASDVQMARPKPAEDSVAEMPSRAPSVAGPDEISSTPSPSWVAAYLAVGATLLAGVVFIAVTI